MIVTVVPQNVASASMPFPLVTSTVEAARLLAAGQAASGLVGVKVAALTEGVLKSMFLKKLAFTTMVVLMFAAFGVSLSGLLHHTQAQEKLESTPKGDKSAKAGGASSKSKTDADQLQGIWVGNVVEVGGRPVVVTDRREDQLACKVQVLVQGSEFTLRGPTFGTYVGFGTPVDNRFGFKLDDKKSPKVLDLEILKGPEDLSSLLCLGLYTLDGDDLKMCLNLANKKRPTAFKTAVGTSQILIELKRDAKAKWEQLPKLDLIPQTERPNDRRD